MATATKKRPVTGGRGDTPIAPPPGKEFLTRNEAAYVVGLRVNHLAKLAMRGEGPPMVRVGGGMRHMRVKDASGNVQTVMRPTGSVRYSRQRLLEWMESHVVAGEGIE
jgi:hypothetical protein